MNLGELLQEREKVNLRLSNARTSCDLIKEQLDQVDQSIHSKMNEEGIENTGTDNYSVRIKHDISPKIKDWREVLEYVYKNKEFGLLFRKINSRVFKDSVDAGVVIPGLEIESYEKLAWRRK